MTSIAAIIANLHDVRSGFQDALGAWVVLVVLAGFMFAALTGIGGFIVFDDQNRGRTRQAWGRVLLFGAPVLSILCLFAGLP